MGQRAKFDEQKYGKQCAGCHIHEKGNMFCNYGLKKQLKNISKHLEHLIPDSKQVKIALAGKGKQLFQMASTG